MPHHKSAIKRVKTNMTRNVRNRHEKKTLRGIVRKVRLTTDPEEAGQALERAIPALDKAARKGFIHRNKAGRSKSRLIKYVRSLSQTSGA